MGKDRELIKRIRSIAGGLPDMYEEAPFKKRLTGSEIAKDFSTENYRAFCDLQEKETGTRAIDPGRVYLVTMIGQVKVNHYRRLTKAFKEAGETGLTQYEEAINQAFKNKTAKTFTSIWDIKAHIRRALARVRGVFGTVAARLGLSQTKVSNSVQDATTTESKLKRVK